MSTPLKSAWRSEQPLRVGAFVVDPSTNELRGAAGIRRLRPILMDVLLRLAADAGRAVPRETLITDVWPRRMVNDEVLSRAIAELRTVLDDDTSGARYIETLPKIGYRLVAQVTPVGADAMTNPTPAQTAPAGPRPAPFPWRHAAGALLTTALAIIAVVGLARRGGQPTLPAMQAIERQLVAAVPFTSDPELEIHPRFSPDGRRVVFIKRDERQSQLVIQDVSTRERKVVLSTEAVLASPVFFPDGKRIAYYRRDADGGCGIFSREVDGPRESRIIACNGTLRTHFDISTDGKWLAFASAPDRQMPSAIQLLDLYDNSSRSLTSPQPGEGADSAPRFSPDSRRVAFFRGTHSHSSVWLAGVQPPHAARRASNDDGLVYGLAWMSGNGPLVVSADWAGFRALHALDLATGVSTLLGARGARYPDISRQGVISYEQAAFRADLWLSSAAEPGRDTRVLWPSTRYSNQAEFSPNGKQVVFASNRDGLEGLYVGTVGGGLQRLPLAAGFRYIRPHWSQDGGAITATRIALGGPMPARQEGIRHNLADSRTEVLTHLGSRVNDVRELAGGELLVSELVEHAVQLMRIAAGGTRMRLPLPLISQYALAGDRLVYTQPQLPGATQCRLASLQCTALAIALNDDNRFDWSLTHDAVWFLSRDDGALVRHNLANLTEKRFAYAPTAVGTNIAVSPDGRQLLLSREAPPLIDLMIAPSAGGAVQAVP